MKVCKFGGTSLSTKDNFLRVKDIILSDKKRKIVVVSAPGKTETESVKVTDLLIALYKNRDDDSVKEQIYSRFYRIINGLNIDLNVEKELGLKENCLYDELISKGEFLTAKILSRLIGYDFLDATKLLRFDDKGGLLKINLSDYKKSLKKGIVVPGFYYYQDGIKTFPRGGSDITASYLARLFNCKIYENFSDVDGIYSINPSYTNSPRVIKVMGYSDYENLSFLNPQVFEKSAYKPVIGSKIKIIVKNTFNPLLQGTTILPTYRAKKTVFISVSKKENVLILSGKNLTKKAAVNTIRAALSGINYVFLEYTPELVKIEIRDYNPKEALLQLYRGVFL